MPQDFWYNLILVLIGGGLAGVILNILAFRLERQKYQYQKRKDAFDFKKEKYFAFIEESALLFEIQLDSTVSQERGELARRWDERIQETIHIRNRLLRISPSLRLLVHAEHRDALSELLDEFFEYVSRYFFETQYRLEQAREQAHAAPEGEGATVFEREFGKDAHASIALLEQIQNIVGDIRALLAEDLRIED